MMFESHAVWSPSVWPLRQRVREAALKSLCAPASTAVFLWPHTFFNLLLLPSGVRSPDPGLTPETCPDPDLNQTGRNASVKEAAQITTPPAGCDYIWFLFILVCESYNLTQLTSLWRCSSAASLQCFYT